MNTKRPRKLQTKTVKKRTINELESSSDEDWLKEKPNFLKLKMNKKDCIKGKELTTVHM